MVSARLEELFGVDLRSLAVVRIAAALLILFDLVTRARFLGPIYTDAGVFPSRVLRETPGLPLSLNALGGSIELQVACFVAAGISALLLLLGLFTRAATLATWVLVASIQNRNPYTMDSGDGLLRLFLFWGIFLPLGARFSLDALRAAAPERRTRVFSAASVAVLFQFTFVYFFSALAKDQPEWRSEGTAILYALGQGWWVRAPGTWLREFPEMLRLATPLVWWFELLAPIALFTPIWTGPARCLLILGFWLFHLVLGVAISLNIFPLVCAAVALVFLPSWFWERLAAWRGSAARAAPEEAPRPAARSVGATLAVNAAVAVLFLWVVAFNIGNVASAVEVPRSFRLPGFHLQLVQTWGMYSPPPKTDFWFAVRGRLEGGGQVDLLAEGTGTGWDEARALHEDYRFKIYLEGFRSPRLKRFRKDYADWFCRLWNEGEPREPRLREVEIIAVVSPIRLDAQPARERLESLVRRDCDGEAAEAGP